MHNLTEDVTSFLDSHILLPISEGRMRLKRLGWVVEEAHVASWTQRANQVVELIGAAVPQLKWWQEASLTCQQYVRFAAAKLQAEAKVNAVDIAGTTCQAMYLLCEATESHRDKAYVHPERVTEMPGSRTPATTLRINEKPESTSCSLGKCCADFDQGPMTDPVYAPTALVYMVLLWTSPSSICKVYCRNQS